MRKWAGNPWEIEPEFEAQRRLSRTLQLRLAEARAWAFAAFQGIEPAAAGDVNLSLKLFAEPRAGDLDNFITGICDGLMACHRQVRIDDSAWVELPEAARPHQAIAFTDDSLVASINARREPRNVGATRYELEVDWQDPNEELTDR